MKEESNPVIEVIFVSIGCYLIGSEYTASLGWGVWFVAMALN